MSLSQNPYYANMGGGGGGFISPYASQSSPGDGTKKTSQYSLRPLTILAMQNAQQAHGEANFTVDGVEVGQVTVVAQVCEPVNAQSTNMLFRIDDGTAQIDARHWLEQYENPEIFADITQGSFVRILGTLKQISNKRHFNAPHIRLASAKEFLFHKSEVMLVWAQMTLGLDQTGAASSGPIPVDGPSAYMPDGGQSRQIDNSKFAHLPPLEGAIIQIMQMGPERDDGIPITAIAKSLNMDLLKVNAADLDAAMLRLMDDGVVYSTIDDSHFALTS